MTGRFAGRVVTGRFAGRAGQDGTATLGLLSMIAAVLVVGLVVVVDVGALTWAAARAQAAADGAALASVLDPGDPRGAARAVAVASGGDLVSCDCRRGSRRAEVVVQMPVGGLVVHRVWATGVRARAAAVSRWEAR